MKGNAYETRRYLNEYLLFHYGRPRDICPFGFIQGKLLSFHERLRKECLLPLRARNLRGATRKVQRAGEGGPLRTDKSIMTERFDVVICHVAIMPKPANSLQPN